MGPIFLFNFVDFVIFVNYTASLLRPLPLLLASTFLPALVCMRFKKPWRLFLLILFGW